ncbi:MAG: hypothetical protein HYT73_01285 [Candidatus Aenigmarchaeota archaeon]|nr:hypothetical protein [Candidatus Aenigmarchaeota archaeon]
MVKQSRGRFASRTEIGIFVLLLAISLGFSSYESFVTGYSVSNTQSPAAVSCSYRVDGVCQSACGLSDPDCCLAGDRCWVKAGNSYGCFNDGSTNPYNNEQKCDTGNLKTSWTLR